MAISTLSRTFEVLDIAAAQFSQAECVGQRNETGTWEWQSTQDFKTQVDSLARGFIKLGLAPGTKVAIAAYKNRPQWMAVDLACAQTGLISIPVYPTISTDDYRFIFDQAEVAYAFVGAGDLFEKVEAAGADTKSFVQTYVFDAKPGRKHWFEVLAKAEPELDQQLQARRNAIHADDLATIIYTSGTTGKPKGVMLSHRNICSAVQAAGQRISVEAGDTVLSFLPLCHIFERTASHLYLAIGTRLALTGTDNLGGPDGDFLAVRPHFFTTVPRLLEKVYEKIYARGAELTGVKKRIFFWALSLTEQYDYQHPISGIGGFLADRLVFSKWREALGGRVKAVVTGAAPCPNYILRSFSAAGIPVREAYGLTETSPGLTINEPNVTGALLGTVGPVVLHSELMIDDSGDYREGEGEILAHGPNVMLGYYKRPDATADVFTEIDGKKWFRTGDIGTFVTGPSGRQFLKITDRKKELLKTSGGKYVAPAPIESAFQEHALIENVMVIGDAQKFVSALIVLAEDPLRKWYAAQGKTFNTMAAAIEDADVLREIQKIIDQTNPRFAHIEQIKKFALVLGPWDVTHADGSIGELTPTLKLKRRVVQDKYRIHIDQLYT